MISKIISWSLKNRYIVLLIAAGLFAWGIYKFKETQLMQFLICENQVIVFTEWMGKVRKSWKTRLPILW